MNRTGLTDLEKLNLKGNVKKVKTLRQVIDKDEFPILFKEKEFNGKGFLLKEVIYDRGEVYSTTTYDYVNNKLNTEIETTQTPNGYVETKKYNYKDNEIEVKVFEDDELIGIFTKKTDKNDRIVYSKDNNYLFNSYCEKTYTYNQNNNLISITEDCYNEDGKNYSNNISYDYKDVLLVKMKHSNTIKNDNVGFTEHYSYDNLNQCTEITVTVNNKLDSKETKAYKNGLLTEHHFFEKEKEVKTIKYEYDQRGNKTKELLTEIFSGATITTVFTFEITYYN